MLQKADNIKKIKASKDHEEDWMIVENEPLELDHILVLLVAADAPKAYRAYNKVICGDPEEKEEKELNYEIYQFSRLLREAVECYGSILTHFKRSEIFYYPVNTLDSILFGSYIAKFNAPIMTTPSLQSALISTDNGNGYILELIEYDSRLTYFDMTCLGKNILKEQIIFNGGALPLRISNIRQVALEKNYKKYISALSVLDTIISGERPNDKPTKYELELINKILNKDNDGFNEYIKNLFEYYVIYAKRVKINFYWFKEYYSELTKDLIRDDIENIPLIANIVKFFPCCEYLGIESGYQGIDANDKYLGVLLEEVSKIKDSGHELKEIELLNSKFQMPVVFGQYMEKFFNAGFDVSIQKKAYDKSLLFKAVEDQ